ncbi:DUF3253 domain-containing protein [Nesterenkonia sp. LB17]|uniref:DUF3253 domain-containing protein n=1 Tax=unclassified Nesterenkonia TaxID=2629769 RepID=UPI001F4C587E|nr:MULTISPECIES: DUF3253 domain-containing protein [unclassified Nesterenkonia]MCH8562115.1 DUF3253 domain-containing protein [Nesterenkonia sp. YGD6]MCH8564355.1 DUF3253 domain-containing protein [Nesterenkonia sp. LB17]MCH8569981.1 DUF3253 domain-containing protein [Nesterenkonia sp. AY15]
MDEPRPAASDRDMENAILDLLAKRAETATICPSEAARAVAGEDWRDQMDAARAAARRLEAAGVVEITQRGTAVDPATARGPIRIRRRPPDTDTR